MKLSFEVGTREKHLVDFRWNQMWGSLRIIVDGKIIERRFFQLASPNKPASSNCKSTEDSWVIFGKKIDLLNRWEFTVGRDEKHTVTIEKRRQKWLAGIRPQHYRVLIDGIELKSCTGY
jgi:hypothetical protein